MYPGFYQIVQHLSIVSYHLLTCQLRTDLQVAGLQINTVPTNIDLYSSTPLQADTIATTTMATTPQMQHPPSTPNTIYPPWYHHSAAGMLNLGCWAAPAHQTPTIK
jgi:hypothetical protein